MCYHCTPPQHHLNHHTTATQSNNSQRRPIQANESQHMPTTAIIHTDKITTTRPEPEGHGRPTTSNQQQQQGGPEKRHILGPRYVFPLLYFYFTLLMFMCRFPATSTCCQATRTWQNLFLDLQDPFTAPSHVSKPTSTLWLHKVVTLLKQMMKQESLRQISAEAVAGGMGA